MADRRGTADAYGAGGERAGDRGRPAPDVEALSVAIGARRATLDAMAARRRGPPQPAQSRRRGRGPGQPAWRPVLVLLVLVAAALAVGGGVYRSLPQVGGVAPTRATGDASRGASAADASLTREQRRAVERLLARLDFRVGAVDGRIDAQTRAAIVQYRRFRGRAEPDGRVTAGLLAELRAVAALANGGGAGVPGESAP